MGRHKKTTRQSKALRLAWKLYLKHILACKRYSLTALIMPGIGNIFVFYIPPYIISRIIEKFDGKLFTLQEVLPYIFAVMGTWLFGEFLWRVGSLLAAKTELTIMERLYEESLFRLLGKDPAFFQDNFAGSLTKKALGYARNFEGFFDTIFGSVASNLVSLLFAIVALWLRAPILALSLIGFMAVSTALIFPLIIARKKLVDIREDASNVLAGHVADVISNMQTVHAYANEELEMKKHHFFVSDYMSKANKSWMYSLIRIDGMTSPLYVLTNVAGLVFAISLGKNGTQVATIFLTFSYFSNATRVLWEFNRIFRNIESNLSDSAQYTALLLDEPKVNDPDEPLELFNPRGQITFQDVSFSYSTDNNKSLFNKLNLTIQPGEKVALVGPSGGGKTTITKLLLRFTDISSGSLSIDGIAINAMTKKTVRSLISYVPQEPQMFHRSISDNIMYGKQSATHADILAAAKNAHAHEFIKSLPDAYETLVGERGMKLSGGQRQRIAIARAMLKDAPILILDEATSALDSESEKLIQDALWKLMENKTAIVIAHRLSTIQKMDRIIVLSDGAIVEEGSHKELLTRKNGHYARHWAHQSGGFIDD